MPQFFSNIFSRKSKKTSSKKDAVPAIKPVIEECNFDTSKTVGTFFKAKDVIPIADSKKQFPDIDKNLKNEEIPFSYAKYAITSSYILPSTNSNWPTNNTCYSASYVLPTTPMSFYMSGPMPQLPPISANYDPSLSFPLDDYKTSYEEEQKRKAYQRKNSIIKSDENDELKRIKDLFDATNIQKSLTDDNENLLKQAIADAKAVRQTALYNAKSALEEAFNNKTIGSASFNANRAGNILSGAIKQSSLSIDPNKKMRIRCNVYIGSPVNGINRQLDHVINTRREELMFANNSIVIQNGINRFHDRIKKDFDDSSPIFTVCAGASISGMNTYRVIFHGLYFNGTNIDAQFSYEDRLNKIDVDILDKRTDWDCLKDMNHTCMFYLVGEFELSGDQKQISEMAIESLNYINFSVMKVGQKLYSIK